MQYLLYFLKTNFIYSTILLLVVSLVFTLLCDSIVALIITSYTSTQRWLLSKSTFSNKLLISKLMIFLYRMEKRSVSFLIRISPFSFDINASNVRFEPKLLNASSRKNLRTIITCFSLSFLMNIVLNNIALFSKMYYTISDTGYITTGISFIYENKLFLLTTLGVLSIVYSVFQDKFTNKIITQIQDEELKHIIITHKELVLDFITLRNILCQNINHFLDIPKDNGVLFQLYNNLSITFPAFKYDIKNKEFQKIDVSTCNFRQPFLTKSFGYNKIENIIKKMDLRIDEFAKSNSFYRTSAINKYIKGLDGFDIARAIKRNNTSTLLCEEFFINLCKESPEHLNNAVHDPNADDKHIAKILTDRLHLINECSFIAALDTIEYTIDIEKYIYKFSKTFALKTRRKELPLEQIFEKYK